MSATGTMLVGRRVVNQPHILHTICHMKHVTRYILQMYMEVPLCCNSNSNLNNTCNDNDINNDCINRMLLTLMVLIIMTTLVVVMILFATTCQYTYQWKSLRIDSETTDDHINNDSNASANNTDADNVNSTIAEYVNRNYNDNNGCIGQIFIFEKLKIDF